MKIVFDRNVHFENHLPKCPICNSPADVFKRRVDPKDVYEGWCETCGNIRITDAALNEARSSNKLPLVAAWLKRHPSNETILTLQRENVLSILRDSPSPSVLEKLDATLREIANKTDYPGLISQFRYISDWPLVYAQNAEEVLFYQTQLADLGLIENRTTPRLTAQGFKRLSEIESSGKQSSIAFVAMWFDETQDRVWEEAIARAIRKAGYKPLRIDKHQHVNRIDDEIIGQIKRSRFMVADFTGQRAGVYFESGLMLGLGRNVIWMCHKEELQKVHFDTRQYNFIDYASLEEASKRLYDRILAIEGEGPEAASV